MLPAVEGGKSTLRVAEGGKSRTSKRFPPFPMEEGNFPWFRHPVPRDRPRTELLLSHLCVCAHPRAAPV